MLFPKEIWHKIFFSNYKSSQDIHILCCVNHELYIYARPFYDGALKRELENSVFTSKPFFPRQIINKTRSNELYQNPIIINFSIRDKHIGRICSQYNGLSNHWYCTCVVPEYFITVYYKYAFQIYKSTNFKIDKINDIIHINEVYCNHNINYIVWNYNMAVEYHNLSNVQNDFWRVWSIIYNNE